MYFIFVDNLLNSIYYANMCCAQQLQNTYEKKNKIFNEKANQREEEYKNQIKTLTTRLKEVLSKCVMALLKSCCVCVFHFCTYTLQYLNCSFIAFIWHGRRKSVFDYTSAVYLLNTIMRRSNSFQVETFNYLNK